MISLEDWALIRHLHRSEGLSQRAIARQLSIARDTVASAQASDGPPKYERAASPSAINEVEPRIRALLSAYPGMPATVIAERVGWTGSISWFRERVRAIRPEYLPAVLVMVAAFSRKVVATQHLDRHVGEQQRPERNTRAVDTARLRRDHRTVDHDGGVKVGVIG